MTEKNKKCGRCKEKFTELEEDIRIEDGKLYCKDCLLERLIERERAK